MTRQGALGRRIDTGRESPGERTLTKEQTARLEELQADFTKMAYWLHKEHIPDMPPKDILGEMNLAVVARAGRDSTFLDQKKAYIINLAVWRARNAATKDRCYTNYLADPVDDTEPLAYIADDAELDFGLDIRQALAGLGDKSRAIVLLLGQGYRRVDIARIMNISASDVSYHIKKSRAHFTEALGLLSV